MTQDDATVPSIIIIDHELRCLRELGGLSGLSRCQSAGIFITARANLRRNYRQPAPETWRYRFGIFRVTMERRSFGRKCLRDRRPEMMACQAFSTRITFSSGMPCLRDRTLRYFYLLTNEIFSYSRPEVRVPVPS